MNKADLIAPETYNIVSEIEKYANDPSKSDYFNDQTGKERDITYNQLIKMQTKLAMYF